MAIEEAPKSAWQIILTCMGVFLFVTLLSFSTKSSIARQTMYSTIEYIEVYGYEPDVISEYAQKSGTEINVTPIDVENGYRYKVSVSFDHFFAVLKFQDNYTYEATTRVVEY